MGKFVGKVRTDMVGSEQEFEFFIDDEELEYLSDLDIEEIAMREMLQTIEWDYERVE